MSFLILAAFLTLVVLAAVGIVSWWIVLAVGVGLVVLTVTGIVIAVAAVSTMTESALNLTARR